MRLCRGRFLGPLVRSMPGLRAGHRGSRRTAPEIRFAKVNTEQEHELAAHFGIRSIPTLMIFRDNFVVFVQAGALSAAALDEVLADAAALDMDAVRKEAAAQENAEKAANS